MTEQEQPEETGSAGTQNESHDEIIGEVVKTTPFDDPIVIAAYGLAADPSRRQLTDVERSFFAAALSRFSNELRENKNDLKEVRRRLDETIELLARANIDVEVLRERLRNSAERRHLKNFSIWAGAALMAFTASNASKESAIFWAVGFVVGLIFVILGWIFDRKSAEQ